MSTQEQSAGTQATEAGCKGALDKVLALVDQDLEKLEALKKLPALKAQIESFKKKLEQTVEEYRGKYPALREKWCAQQQIVETLKKSLECGIEDWDEVIKECICPKLEEIRCMKDRIDRRKRCCHGPRERARNEAKARMDEAKLRLDALVANTTGITSREAEDDKLIKDITAYLSGEKYLALNAFFFKLLPNHTGLRPDDVDDKCLPFDGLTPKKLCPEGDCKNGDPCKGEDKTPAVEKPKRRDVPWLVDPDSFEGALECAWDDFYKASQAFGTADAAYLAAPDDLAALEKQLGELKKASDEKITKCLKDKKAKDCCSKPESGKQPNDSHAKTEQAE
jgi:hypothetical protein